MFGAEILATKVLIAKKKVEGGQSRRTSATRGPPAHCLAWSYQAPVSCRPQTGNHWSVLVGSGWVLQVPHHTHAFLCQAYSSCVSILQSASLEQHVQCSVLFRWSFILSVIFKGKAAHLFGRGGEVKSSVPYASLWIALCM